VTLPALDDNSRPPSSSIARRAVEVHRRKCHRGSGRGGIGAVVGVVSGEQPPGKPEPDRPPAPDEAALPLDLTDSRFLGLRSEFGAPLGANCI
jgi:hypothetical protein